MAKRRAGRNPDQVALHAPLFGEGAKPPGDAALAGALGRAKQPWDGLLADLVLAHPRAALEWKHYRGNSGWQLVARLKGRSLCYLKPLKDRFTVGLALSDEALDEAERAGLPAKLIASARSSPEYPEGRATRMDVTSAAGAGIAAGLIAIRAASIAAR